jgi:adenylate cyclase
MLDITSARHAWQARDTASVQRAWHGMPAAGARPAFAAVLFADIVGFTRHCEALSSTSAFALLSEFHHRMARVLTAHAPSVEDAIGDGVMAAWGGPEPDGTYAACALSCAFAILDSIARWNCERPDGRGFLAVGIGLHAGTATFGRISTGGGAKPGVFGDTVNITHRLERMTRTLASDLIVSDALFRMVQAVAPQDAFLERFRAPASTTLPGRACPMLVRTANVSTRATWEDA